MISQNFTAEIRYETETNRDCQFHPQPQPKKRLELPKALFAPSVVNHAHHQHTLTAHHKLLHEWIDGAPP